MTAHDATPHDATPDEAADKPHVTDKRRIDPETGRRRDFAAEAAAPAGAGPAAGDGPAVDAAAAGATQADAALSDAAATGEDELDRARAEALDLADQLARRSAEVYNVQQEYNSYVRRSKADAATQRQAGVNEVVESLLGVLDEIELARQHGDLTGPFAAIAEKLETALAQRFAVERFGQVGEEFDPEVHEALMHSTDAEVSATTVTQVLQPGYRAGDRVLRAARVAVSSPE